MLNFACWNLTSFSVEKVSILCQKFDIFGVVETWTHSESAIDLPDFDCFHLPGIKKKHVRKGRRSGGVIIYFRRHIAPGISLVCKRNYGLWIKLDKAFFNLEYDIYLAVIYIKPKYSHQDNEEIFCKLSQDIVELSCRGKIFLSGDFNSRTGICPDYIEDDSYLPTNGSVTLPDDYILDLNLKRNSRDRIVNAQGKLLLEICIESRLRMLNGRFLGDSVGNFTYFDPLGGCSLVDYMIISEDILHCISYFNVMYPNELSGHCVISAGININVPHDKCEDLNNMEFWLGNFIWDDNISQYYQEQLESDDSIRNLSVFFI